MMMMMMVMMMVLMVMMMMVLFSSRSVLGLVMIPATLDRNRAPRDVCIINEQVETECVGGVLFTELSVTSPSSYYFLRSLTCDFDLKLVTLTCDFDFGL